MRSARGCAPGGRSRRGWPWRCRDRPAPACSRPLSPPGRNALHLADLVDAAGVAAAGELRVEPRAENLKTGLASSQPSGQREHVGVVVLAAHPRREDIAAESRADAGDLVGRDGHADARAADENAAFDLAYRDGLGDLERVVGIVDRVGAVGAEVDDLVASV